MAGPTSQGSGGIFKLGRLVPERIPLSVTRPNVLKEGEGEPDMVEVIVQAYVYGPGTPGLVKAELASITERYMLATRDDAGAYQRNSAAWHTYLREVIQTMVPGLTPDEVDVLAGEDDIGTDGTGTALLRHLKFWKPREDGEISPDPEAKGEELTTPDSSPISAQPSVEPPLETGLPSPSV